MSAAVFIASGVAILLEESVLDGTYTRFALVVTTPFLFCVSLVRSLHRRVVSSNLMHVAVLLTPGRYQRFLHV